MSINGKFKVVLLRHGESEWNNENKFCGWYDADLSDTGLAEAKSAGKVHLLSLLIIPNKGLFLLHQSKELRDYAPPTTTNADKS